MHLVYALARDVNRQLVQSGPDPEQLFGLSTAIGFLQLTGADSIIQLLTSATARNGTEPALKQVLLSPAVLPCLTLMLAAAAYRPTAEQQRRAAAQAASSSGGGGGTHPASTKSSRSSRRTSRSGRQADQPTEGDSISPAAAAVAWQAANQSQALLPASHQQLCALLAVDVRLLLTLANLDMRFNDVVARDIADVEASDSMLAVYGQLMHLWGLDVARHLWEQKPAEQQQLELQLLLLLPTVLLHCAGKIPTSSPMHGKYCLAAGTVCQGATYAWSRLSRHKASEAGGRQGLCSHQQQQQQEQQEQQQQEPVQLTAAWVAEVLPAALKLAWRVLPQLQEDADILNAAEPSAQGSSSSSSTDGAASSSQSDGHSRSASVAGTGADSALPKLRYGTSAHRGECLHNLLCFFSIICDSVLPPAVTGPGSSSSDRTSAIMAYFNVDKGDLLAGMVNEVLGRGGASSSQSDAAVGNGSQGQEASSSEGAARAQEGSQGQEASSSEGAARAQSDMTSQPLAASDSIATTAVAGSVVAILRVLEAFMRTAAGAPAMPLSWVDDAQHSRASETPLNQLLGYTMVPTAACSAPSFMRNTDWDYEPAAPALLQLAVGAGPGSAAQHALYSLLFSVVKLSLLQSSKAPGILQDPDRCVLLAVDAATHLLRASATAAVTAGTAAASEGSLPACTASTDTAAVAAAAAGLTAASTSTEGLTAGSTRSAEPSHNAPTAQQQAAGLRPQSSAAVQLLPSIVIFGRLCLLYGQQLPAKIPMLVQIQEFKTDKGLRGMSSARRTQLINMYQREAPRNSVADVLWREAPGGNGFDTKFDLYIKACLDWLSSGDVSEQLAAAGYGSAASTAVQQLQALAAALNAALDSEAMGPGPFAALAQQLLETGKALSSFAVPLCCNHPVCANISRTLEVSLVSGHSTKCSGCKVARYCCRQCQKQHWKQHKLVCQALAAARVGKGASGAA